MKMIGKRMACGLKQLNHSQNVPLGSENLLFHLAIFRLLNTISPTGKLTNINKYKSLEHLGEKNIKLRKLSIQVILHLNHIKKREKNGLRISRDTKNDSYTH